MATYFTEPSRTFGEYLLVPGYSSAECIPANCQPEDPAGQISARGEGMPALHEHPAWYRPSCSRFPTTHMAIALAKEGGISFIYGSQSIERRGRHGRPGEKL